MNFKSAREKSGYTQAFVAKQLGTTRVTVARWELGISEADYATLTKLSKLYNCSIDYLLNPLPPPATESGAETARTI